MVQFRNWDGNAESKLVQDDLLSLHQDDELDRVSGGTFPDWYTAGDDPGPPGGWGSWGSTTPASSNAGSSAGGSECKKASMNLLALAKWRL